MDVRQEAVWQVVQELNRAWTGGQPERLEEFFHPEMVALTPADPRRLESGAACVAAGTCSFWCASRAAGGWWPTSSHPIWWWRMPRR